MVSLNDGEQLILSFIFVLSEVNISVTISKRNPNSE